MRLSIGFNWGAHTLCVACRLDSGIGLAVSNTCCCCCCGLCVFRVHLFLFIRALVHLCRLGQHALQVV